jgi:REP element-mobilizing transposase RayT
MPAGLRRYYGTGDLHFITCSCYQRQAWLATAQRRDLFLSVLERMRKRYQFVVVGYVVMPEHFHLLISEPQEVTPAMVMQAVKLGFARRVLAQLRARRNPAQASLFRACSAARVAGALLRFQCLDVAEAGRKTAIYAS